LRHWGLAGTGIACPWLVHPAGVPCPTKGETCPQGRPHQTNPLWQGERLTDANRLNRKSGAPMIGNARCKQPGEVYREITPNTLHPIALRLHPTEGSRPALAAVRTPSPGHLPHPHNISAPIAL